jgi:hypothetical protein
LENESIKEYSDKYYDLHKAQIKEQHRKYYEDNRDKILAHCKEYRDSHKLEYAEYYKEYYKRNESKVKAASKRYTEKYRRTHPDWFGVYYQKHKKSILERNAIWKATHKEEVKAHHSMLYQKNKIKIKEISKKRNLKNKIDALTHYGNGKCACVRCGYDDIRALSIDHINGGGAKHRREINNGGGSRIYNWLIKNEYPNGFQTLCLNCQFLKREENKELDGKQCVDSDVLPMLVVSSDINITEAS